MEKPWDEPMPQQELDVFAKLDDIQVVFDVGARTSLDYLTIKPEATYHLFEPFPQFYSWLKEECKDKPNIYVNGYGLGEIEGDAEYSSTLQSFLSGGSGKLPIKTLNWYIKQNSIQRIDFLKVDAEGWDYKVLLGGSKAIKMARYIQYETWNERENEVMRDLLEDDFSCKEIGFRNILCKRK